MRFEQLEARCLLSAALDPTFGTRGIATIDLGEVQMAIADVSVLSDGSVLAAGEARLPDAAAGIARLNPDGTSDARFAPGGFLTDTPGGMTAATCVETVEGPSVGTSLIYVAGVRREIGLADRVVLSRYTRFGKHDRSLDVRGRGSVLVPQLTSVGDIHVLPDGSILLAGTATNGDATVLKLAPNAKVDTTFGINGMTPTSAPPSGETRTAGALAVDSSRRIVIGVTVSNPTSGDTVIVRRFTSSGALDASFNGTGTAGVPELSSGGVRDETLRGLVVDPSNRVHVYYGRGTGDQMRMVRFVENGQLDTGFFGTNGIAAMPDDFTTGAFDFGGARMSAITGLTLIDGGRTASRFVGGATDRSGALVPGIVEVPSDGLPGGLGSFGVTEIEGVENAHAILAPSPGAMLVAVAIPNDNAFVSELSFARFFTDARPSAMLNIKPVQAGTGAPAQFWVTYRSGTGIDLSTIDSGDLHITLPDGSVRSAHVSKIEPNADNTEVTVRYKIPAPGGLWDSADNGDYVIRLRGREDGVRTPAFDIFAHGSLLGILTVDL